MQMTDLEIVGKFKRADNKKEILQVLADLNVCKVDDIKEVLVRNGISEDEFPKKRGKKPKPKENSEPKRIDKQVKKISYPPASVVRACTKKATELREQIIALKKEYDELMEFLNEVKVDDKAS